MLRPVQLKTPLPVAGVAEMVVPEGPVNVFKDTEMLEAPPDPDSRIRLKAVTSFRPPNIEIFEPSQTELVVLEPEKVEYVT